MYHFGYTANVAKQIILLICAIGVLPLTSICSLKYTRQLIDGIHEATKQPEAIISHTRSPLSNSWWPESQHRPTERQLIDGIHGVTKQPEVRYHFIYGHVAEAAKQIILLGNQCTTPVRVYLARVPECPTVKDSVDHSVPPQQGYTAEAAKQIILLNCTFKQYHFILDYTAEFCRLEYHFIYGYVAKAAKQIILLDNQCTTPVRVYLARDPECPTVKDSVDQSVPPQQGYTAEAAKQITLKQQVARGSSSSYQAPILRLADLYRQ